MNVVTKKTKIYVHNPNDIPNVEHFAIFEGSSYHTEASGQWAPGHGYDAETHNFVTYVAYLNEQEFIADLKDLQTSRFTRREFRGVKISAPYTFETSVKAP